MHDEIESGPTRGHLVLGLLKAHQPTRARGRPRLKGLSHRAPDVGFVRAARRDPRLRRAAGVEARQQRGIDRLLRRCGWDRYRQLAPQGLTAYLDALCVRALAAATETQLEQIVRGRGLKPRRKQSLAPAIVRTTPALRLSEAWHAGTPLRWASTRA
jgi:hypothetical protein